MGEQRLHQIAGLSGPTAIILVITESLFRSSGERAMSAAAANEISKGNLAVITYNSRIDLRIAP
jgi:hypothetical protein